jgi:2'-hydroxyisoflavone reductase
VIRTQSPLNARETRRGSSGGAVLDLNRRVAEESWDVVVGVTRHPVQVRGAVAALAEATRLFVFVSSGNVYADHSFPGQDETGELVAGLDRDVMESMESYGPAKVACEQLVRQGFGQERALIARVGLIGGPGDVFDRTGYWPLRLARPASEDGAVLVPECARASDTSHRRPRPRGVDRRCERQGTGWHLQFHRPDDDLLRASGDCARSRPTQWAPGPRRSAVAALARRAEWMGERSMPLWIADPDWIGFNAMDSGRARGAGLMTRPLRETLADTLAWELTRDPARIRQAGLSDADERALLSVYPDSL